MQRNIYRYTININIFIKMNKMNQLIGPNAFGLYPGGLVKVGFELNNLMTLNLAWKAS